MKEVLGNRSKNELRETLASLNREFTPSNETRPSFKLWKIVLTIFVLALGVGLWIWTSDNQPPTQNSEEVLDAKTPVPVQDSIEEPSIPLETPDSPPLEKTPDLPKPTPPLNNPPIAGADYSPMPFLENLMAENLRDNIQMTEIFPPNDHVFIIKKNSTDLVFSGTILNYSGEDIQLNIYNNNEEDFNKGKSLLTQIIHFDKVSDTQSFRFERSVKLPKGLYYFVIEPTRGRTVLYVGKFRIE
ncbi:MAG: hypothetical protein D6714_02650 [Bacteroidetes bacterium]|nr:MAG: hypothetical protein D6714_02650 [Bacteroidota bacterium]